MVSKDNKVKSKIKKEHISLILLILGGLLVISLIGFNSNLQLEQNQVTGYAFTTIDPIKGLGGFLSDEIGIAGGSYPFGLVLAALAVIFSVLFVGARNTFFKDAERLGAAIVFSLGATIITVYATNLLGILVNLMSYLGYFSVIVVALLLGLNIYFAAHTRIREGYRDITQLAAQGQEHRNTLITNRNAQPQPNPNQPTPLGRIFNRIRHPLRNPPQQQTARVGRQQRGQTQRQAQQNLRQQQAIRQRWLLYLQQAQQNLNLLANQLNDQRNWNTVLGQLARISQIRRDSPNIRTGNIGTLLRNGQTHMQRILANPNDARTIALATQFLSNVQTTYNLILNQL